MAREFLGLMTDLGELRVLTVQQPWSWAIVSGAKVIENRTRGMSHRGLLAIHAGARWSDRGAADPRVYSAARAAGMRIRPATEAVVPDDDTIPMSAVVGVVDLVESHPDGGCCLPWGESAYDENGGRRRISIHHLVLERAFALPEPVPCGGSLGLWRAPADVRAAVIEQVPTHWLSRKKAKPA